MRRSIYKGYYEPWWPDWFAYHYACWANNHRGWQKKKKQLRRRARKKQKRDLYSRIKEETE